MDICVVATTALPCPPTAYGGMERAAWLLARGLAEIGNRVTLMAREGSRTPVGGRLIVMDDEHHSPQYADFLESDSPQNAYIDITHDHRLSVERPDLGVINNLQVMSLMGNGINPVLISFGQWRAKFQAIKEAEVIYQPIDLEELEFYDGPRDEYLLYMGQRIPEKRIELACQLAIQTQTPLEIYGPGWGDPKYHELLDKYRTESGGLIGIHSDIGGAEKLRVLQRAKALVHPVGGLNWCEAGAIVVLEALAVGTPVIASLNGCLPEYITDSYNGFLAEGVASMIEALDLIGSIQSADCRESVLGFDYRLAAGKYETLCKLVTQGARWNA